MLDEANVKRKIVNYLQAAPRFRKRLVFWALILPTNLYIAKFFLVIANILLSYNCFRVNGLWRASNGAGRLQTLLNDKRVTWTPSNELQEMVEQFSKKAELDNAGYVFANGGDLHDDVISSIEAKLKIPELTRTYRRTRMNTLVFGES